MMGNGYLTETFFAIIFQNFSVLIWIKNEKYINIVVPFSFECNCRYYCMLCCQLMSYSVSVLLVGELQSLCCCCSVRNVASHSPSPARTCTLTSRRVCCVDYRSSRSETLNAQ